VVACSPFGDSTPFSCATSAATAVGSSTTPSAGDEVTVVLSVFFSRRRCFLSPLLFEERELFDLEDELFELRPLLLFELLLLLFELFFFSSGMRFTLWMIDGRLSCVCACVCEEGEEWNGWWWWWRWWWWWWW
jgi:hypothetical protein